MIKSKKELFSSITFTDIDDLILWAKYNLNIGQKNKIIGKSKTVYLFDHRGNLIKEFTEVAKLSKFIQIKHNSVVFDKLLYKKYYVSYNKKFRPKVSKSLSVKKIYIYNLNLECIDVVEGLKDLNVWLSSKEDDPPRVSTHIARKLLWNKKYYFSYDPEFKPISVDKKYHLFLLDGSIVKENMTYVQLQSFLGISVKRNYLSNENCRKRIEKKGFYVSTSSNAMEYIKSKSTYPIFVFDYCGNLLDKFENYKIASKKMGVNISNIRNGLYSKKIVLGLYYFSKEETFPI